MIAQWDQYKNFSKREFDCQESGENEMQHHFMERLQLLRDEFGKPLVVTSGYRSVRHSIEAAKNTPGMHTTGQAVDIMVRGSDAHRLLKLALELGFTGIGVQQKGRHRFIHLDTRTSPTVWSY